MNGVPLADGDVQRHHRPAGLQFDGFLADSAEVVVELLHQPAAKDDHRLTAVPMPVDRQGASRLNCVEHTLGLVLRAVAEVVIHSEARRCLCLRCKVI